MENESWSIYHDLKELTLDRFIDCYCHGTLERLIKSGTPPQDNLIEAWANIQQKYIETIGGEDYSTKVNVITTINELSSKVERIEALIEVLSIAPTEGLFMQLYEFGYSLPKCDYCEANIERLCRQVTSHMKRDVAQIQLLSKQIEDGSSAEQKITEDVFYRILVEISDVFKVVLKENETSVMAFAMYVKRYKDKAEEIKRKQVTA